MGRLKASSATPTTRPHPESAAADKIRNYRDTYRRNRHVAFLRVFQQNRGTIGMACAQAVTLRGAPTTARRHVDAPRRPPPLHMAYDDHDRNVSHIHGFA